MKWAPVIILIVCFFIFISTKKGTVENPVKILDNGCAIYAIQFKMSNEARKMLEPYVWSRVLAIHFYGKVGHAVTVFHYKNITYVYDFNIGTYPIYERYIYDPLEIAEIIFPNLPIKEAYYLEPTFLLHYQTDSFKLYK
jgi:hypothetical protein